MPAKAQADYVGYYGEDDGPVGDAKHRVRPPDVADGVDSMPLSLGSSRLRTKGRASPIGLR